MMNNMIMCMVAQTSIHAGSGQALSVIDLPIQREGYTQHPVIFGSSLKGALRYRANQTAQNNDANDDEQSSIDKETLFAVFGPDPDTKDIQDNSHAGAVMVSDARLLLLPIRSLNGYFKWVTCPALLRRYNNDRSRAGALSLDYTLPVIGDEQVLVADGMADTLFLEEFALTPRSDGSLDSWVSELASNTGIDQDALSAQLAVVNDDMFSYLAQNATQVNAHIALDENKTVKKGALWYEETLPPETVMYSLLMCTDSRNSKAKLNSNDISKVLTGQILPENNRYLQVGGNETVGMGWFHVNFIALDEA